MRNTNRNGIEIGRKSATVAPAETGLGCRVEPLEGRALFSAAATDPTAAPADSGAAAGTTAAVTQPTVRLVNPANGATGILRDSFLSCELNLPNGGVDSATLTTQTVYLYRRADGVRVRAVVSTSGAGDVIILRPLELLDPNAKYSLAVTDEVKDVTGVPFKIFITTFTTGPGTSNTDPNVHFDKVALNDTVGRQYLGLTVGPDNRLYAGTAEGEIVRFPINADGALGAADVIDSLVKADGGPSFVTGLAFDPASTADNPILWVSRSAAAWLNAPDWTGKITVLSGANLEVVQDKVTHLPRATRDHLTDQLAFGPDGAIYFCQAANSAMGAADLAWGSRPERLLSAAVLRLDPAKLGTGTLDALTPDGGGTYNPYSASAPLSLYATGVRNTYDMVWRDGQLWAFGNGSAAGGNTPAGPGVPAITGVAETETDYLFHIEKGGFYGHPNPLRHEYVLNGGNPTAGVDPYEIKDYPVGTLPDPDWRPAAYDMGAHESPDGAIVYHGTAFGGALDNKLLVCRYSGGGDIVAVDIGADGKVAGQLTGMDGMTGFVNPLDLTEQPSTGNLYVIEFGGQRLTLLRPADSSSGVGASTGSDGGGTTTEPPPVVTPTPTPGPIPIPDADRTRRDRRLIRVIQKYAPRHNLTMPDVTTTPGANLKTMLAGLKDQARRNAVTQKITRLATKKDYPLPNTSTYALGQLHDLLHQIRKAKAAA